MATPNRPDGANSKDKPKKQLGKYCVAGGPGNVSCKNNSLVEGISMHGFPKTEGTLRNSWIKFVQKHRPKWQPSSYSALCSAHFEPRCYLQWPDIAIKQLEPDKPFLTKRMLHQKVAYPTIDTVQPEQQPLIISPRERRKVCCRTRWLITIHQIGYTICMVTECSLSYLILRIFSYYFKVLFILFSLRFCMLVKAQGAICITRKPHNPKSQWITLNMSTMKSKQSEVKEWKSKNGSYT